MKNIFCLDPFLTKKGEKVFFGQYFSERMVSLVSHPLPITFRSLTFMRTSDFPHANVGFSALREKYPNITPLLPKNRLFVAQILLFSSASMAHFSFLGSSLNAVEVFNAKRAAWVTSRLKTTTAFIEEPN